MDQGWFEMRDFRCRNLAAVGWVPLRAARTIDRVGQSGYVGFREDRFSAGSLAVPARNRSDALTLSWYDIGISNNHGGYFVDDRYVPADVYEDLQRGFEGIRLVLNQWDSGKRLSEWHLHQDLVITLGLTRENDKWVRSEEGFIEVARLMRSSDGRPALLEARASHLRDYLCARRMGLLLSSYRIRSEVIEDPSYISWTADQVEERGEDYRWVGSKRAIHEGGHPYGESVFVMHMRRTDVNPEDDVPVLGDPTDANLRSTSWTKGFSGRKLYRLSGAVWRTEWLEPASQSPIVRGDKLPASVSFVIDAEGRRATADELVDTGRWLWFRPTVVPALLDKRGSSLSWYTRNTGSVACSPGYNVYFGINAIGLVNTYAKNVALLPEWQQRVWAAHNANPEGGLSEELKASHIDATPASTEAPEALLPQERGRLQTLAQEKLKITFFRQHNYVAELIPRSHRFRVTDTNGLFALAKDLARIIVEDIDNKNLQSIVEPPNGESWNSLKSLERVLATKIDRANAQATLGPLRSVYKLRLADAHLPSNDIGKTMRQIRVDDASPPIVQGYQLLDAAVATIRQIGDVIESKW